MLLGTIGSLALLVAFVACIASGVAFFKGAKDGPDADVWKRYGRIGWGVMAAGVAISSIILWILLFGRRFEYAYIYQHTSHAMPWRYTFSAFWAGQEGSFSLWIIMTTLVGGALLFWSSRTKGLSEGAITQRRFFEAPVMAVVALCQVFLLSMIVGIKLGPLAIGSSPFMALADKFPDAPMLQVAGFIPPDGQGLNDLLQNPWMVIHPPTLFVGFTMMMVPFAFAVAGLWKGRYTQWVKPALPWSLAGTAILFLGIMMGGYWAYVTLSFGGWWAWDPVENSSLVPWIFGVAALHAMVVQKKTSAGHKAALILSVVAFQFVIFSTFLTRSGILGDVSVHSFVDLGLYNQLLLWILSIGILGFGLFAYRYKELPAPKTPPATLSRESMIFTGALLLAMTGLVIILGTSAPIFGKIFRDNPSGVPIAFYNAWTIPLAIGIAFLAGLGQLFWWRKMSIEDVNRVLLKPLVLTVVSTGAILLITPFVQETIRPATELTTATVIEAGILPASISSFLSSHGTSLLLLMLLFTAFFALYGNLFVLFRVARGNLKLAGGSLAHVGFGLALLGIFASSVFNDPVSDGVGTELRGNRDNFVVARGETLPVDGYEVVYSGTEETVEGRPVYLLDWTSPGGTTFQTRNVVYQDGRGQWIQHPHVREGLFRDLYVAAFPSAMSEDTESSGGELLIQRGESRALNGGAYRLQFIDYDLEVDPTLHGFATETIDLAVAARIEITNTATGESQTLRPIYIITNDREQQIVPDNTESGVGVAFVGMVPDQNAINLVLEGATVDKSDWVVVQAYEKPFISVLWLGVLVILAGFGISVYRRAEEARR